MSDDGKRWPVGRWTVLLLASAAGGVLSGLLTGWHSRVRGAVLAVSLSLGHVMAAVLGRRALDEGRAPGGTNTLATAAAVTMLAVAGLALTERIARSTPVWREAGLSAAGICAIYALGLHAAWHCRRRGRSLDGIRLWAWAVLTALAAGTARVISGVHTSPNELWIWTAPSLVLIGAVFTGLPFSLLWLAASQISDPAASVQRWRRVRGID